MKKKLLDQYLDAIRVKQYSARTGETYMQWVRDYILYHKKRHPKEMAETEINQFITHLVSERKASASTQNQAISQLSVINIAIFQNFGFRSTIFLRFLLRTTLIIMYPNPI